MHNVCWIHIQNDGTSYFASNLRIKSRKKSKLSSIDIEFYNLKTRATLPLVYLLGFYFSSIVVRMAAAYTKRRVRYMIIEQYCSHNTLCVET